MVARAELARLCVSVRKEREGIAQTLFSFSDFLFLRCGTPASEMVLSTFKKGLSCSAKTPRKCPRSHTKDVIKGIQSPVVLTVKTRHRSSYIALFCSLVTPGPSDGLPHVCLTLGRFVTHTPGRMILSDWPLYLSVPPEVSNRLQDKDQTTTTAATAAAAMSPSSSPPSTSSSSSGFVLLFLFIDFLNSESHHVALAIIELPTSTRLVSNSGIHPSLPPECWN